MIWHTERSTVGVMIQSIVPDSGVDSNTSWSSNSSIEGNYPDNFWRFSHNVLAKMENG